MAATTRNDDSAGRAIGKPAPIVDRDRFPNFAALVAGSTWFPNAMSAAPSTTGALPRILTGRDYADVDNTAGLLLIPTEARRLLNACP